MGRRKKEPPDVHRKTIAAAAGRLFTEKGTEAATMDDIARMAGYSKATVYVYFKNKEEIIACLVLESMKKLHGCICLALAEGGGTRGRYDAICQALLQYQEEYPYYFHAALSKINVDLDSPDFLPVEREIFDLGEQINDMLAGFLQEGMEAGELRPGLLLMPTVFSFWGMLSGMIQLSSQKKEYIEQVVRLSKTEFLAYGFDTLYRSIAGEAAS